jgi:hypothetical protein
MLEGQGKMTLKNGTTYEGEFKEDKLIGQGFETISGKYKT